MLESQTQNLHQKLALVGEDLAAIGESPLRSGHYTVKSKIHGFECLRCGMKGYIRDIMEKPCEFPNAIPKYHDDEPSKTGDETFVAPTEPTLPEPDDADVAALQEELQALQLAEAEFDLMEAIQAEQQALEAMAKEQAALETQEKTEKIDGMVADLVAKGFPDEIAHWAVQESKLKWAEALDLAYQRIQREEHEILKEKEKEEKRLAKDTTVKRKPATPCSSTSMPPPPLPLSKTCVPSTQTILRNST